LPARAGPAAKAGWSPGWAGAARPTAMIVPDLAPRRHGSCRLSVEAGERSLRPVDAQRGSADLRHDGPATLLRGRTCRIPTADGAIERRPFGVRPPSGDSLDAVARTRRPPRRPHRMGEGLLPPQAPTPDPARRAGLKAYPITPPSLQGRGQGCGFRCAPTPPGGLFRCTPFGTMQRCRTNVILEQTLETIVKTIGDCPN